MPGADGLAVGATMEPGRSDTEADPAALAPLVEAAGRLFPGLAEATFAVSAGVRAATPDGLPMAGLSQAQGVVLAVGARRNGWLASAPLGRGQGSSSPRSRSGDPGPLCGAARSGQVRVMNGFWFTEEQEAIREGVLRLCARFDADYWRRTDETGDFPEAFVGAMADAGWLGAAMPTELGGSGLWRHRGRHRHAGGG